MNLSVKDAARLLSVSEKTIYRWIQQEILPVYRVRAQYRFNRSEILEWATSRRINVAPETFQEPETDALPLPTLSEALDAGGIYYRLEGKSRDEVLEQVVQHLRLPEEVDRAYLLKVLVARERRRDAAAPEPLGRLRASHQFVMDHFHSHSPLEGCVRGLIDRAHPAPAPAPLHAITSRQESRQPHGLKACAFLGASPGARIVAAATLRALLKRFAPRRGCRRRPLKDHRQA